MITLELTIPETNLVLEALGALPYARVYELINKIHQQAEAQAAGRNGGQAGDPNGGQAGVQAVPAEGSAR
ncbi:hypothetical protein ACRYCC_15180 [Actinomadura scrupuli]|uniref:hypothetical protein n=1 Tax=Actinomadura scrupuli TaxID=559629 RepID=UPI003D9535EF